MTRYPTLAHKSNNSYFNSTSAWPTLEQPSAANLAQQLSQPTNSWLSTAKLGPVLGRSTKVQAPPSPWSKNSMDDYENEEMEDADYMPAPGYKESFFLAIDNSLKLIDESMHRMKVLFSKMIWIFSSLLFILEKMNAWEAEILSSNEPVQNTQLKKKKKKNKQLLFSTH